MKKIFKIFYSLLLFFLAIIALFLIVSVFPIKGNYQTMVVLSGSMEPAIKTGSVVVVKPQGDYAVGDVITFGSKGKGKVPTTHRIVEIKEEKNKKKFVTKGDANNAEDQKLVSKNEIIGKVIFPIPYFGYAVNAAQKPVGFVLIIVIPAVIIIYDEFQKIVKEIKKKIDYRRRAKKRNEDEVSEEDNNKNSPPLEKGD